MPRQNRAGRHPVRTAPDTQQAIDTLREYSRTMRAAASAYEKLANEIDAVLGLSRNPVSEIHSPLLVSALQQLGDTTEQLGPLQRSVSVAAVRDGAISRVEAGKLLGVHQATIARWLKESGEDD